MLISFMFQSLHAHVPPISACQEPRVYLHFTGHFTRRPPSRLCLHVKFRETDTSPHMGHDFRPCDRVIRVYVRVYRVSLVRPGSPRCLFTGMKRSMELGHAEKVLCFHKPCSSSVYP